MAGRASIVGAAATHVGKVREHNEDAHFLDVEAGMFLVCDGMGGHAAGEVASAIAVGQLRQEWASGSLRDVAEQWLDQGTPAAKKRLLDVVRAGVFAAHRAILSEAERDRSKTGMGTTLVGGMVIGGEAVFAHAGDSRAYLVRDGISMQLTEDHTLLARLLAAGIDVDVSGEGSRFRSMLTNALGIGEEVKVSTFVVPLADGDRFLLCSDGISEYVPENEVGEVLSKQSSPARAAQRLVELALERGGGDNATAVVVRVLEAGETPLPAEQRKKDDAAIAGCALWGARVTPQQRLRALRIAIPRDHVAGDKLPPHTLGDRVAWIVVEGELVQDGAVLGPGALIYPESLIAAGGGEQAPLPDRDALAVARGEVRALALRADDFRELCDDDGEIGEALLESLGQVLGKKKQRATPAARPAVDPRGATDPHLRTVGRRDVAEAYHPTDPSMPAVAAPDAGEPDLRDRAATVPDDPASPRPWLPTESAVIVPVEQAPVRPSPLPGQLKKRVAPPLPGPESRPSPLPAQLQARTPATGTPAPRPTPIAMQAEPAPAAPAAASAKPAASAKGKPTKARAGSATKPIGSPAAADKPAPAAPADGAAATTSAPTSATTTSSPATAKSAPAAAASPASTTPAPGATTPRKTAHITPRATPSSGLRPVSATEPAKPARAASDDGEVTTIDLARSEPGDWDERTERIGPPLRRPGTATPPQGFPAALPPAAGSSARSANGDAEPELEIETYLEIEAELPPPRVARDPAPVTAFGSAPRMSRVELEDEHAEISITIEDDTRVTEKVTETSFHTLTVTVIEPAASTGAAGAALGSAPSVTPVPVVAVADVVRPRRITADDSVMVSGTIDEVPPPTAPPPQPRRAKRHSGS